MKFQLKLLLVHYRLLIYKEALLSEGGKKTKKKTKTCSRNIFKLPFPAPKTFTLVEISSAANYHKETNSNWNVMGHFKNQLPIPNTHQFTSQHPPPGAHTTLVCPTSSLRPLAPQGRRPLACAAGPVLLLLGRGIPQTPGREPGGRSRGGRQGWAVNCTSKQKEAGRRPRGWVRAATSAGPRLGMRWAHGHSALANSFSPGGLASTATCL